MAEYRFGGRARECDATGRPFEDGQVIVTAIYEDPEQGFVRKDFCEEHFDGGAGAYSIWRGRVPESPEQAQTVDFDLAQTFLEKLVREADPEREGLLYVLTLLLSRKRRVKIGKTRPLPDGELLTVVLRGPEDDIEVSVRAPRLSGEDVDRLQQELATLFGFSKPEQSTGKPPETA